MKKKHEQVRQRAVQRYNEGESPKGVCMSLGYSKSWLYKWVGRYDIKNSTWNQDHLRLPKNNPWRTSPKTSEFL